MRKLGQMAALDALYGIAARGPQPAKFYLACFVGDIEV